jgi:hypothetical protein
MNTTALERYLAAKQLLEQTRQEFPAFTGDAETDEGRLANGSLELAQRAFDEARGALLAHIKNAGLPELTFANPRQATSLKRIEEMMQHLADEKNRCVVYPQGSPPIRVTPSVSGNFGKLVGRNPMNDQL